MKEPGPHWSVQEGRERRKLRQDSSDNFGSNSGRARLPNRAQEARERRKQKQASGPSGNVSSNPSVDHGGSTSRRSREARKNQPSTAAAGAISNPGSAGLKQFPSDKFRRTAPEPPATSPVSSDTNDVVVAAAAAAVENNSSKDQGDDNNSISECSKSDKSIFKDDVESLSEGNRHRQTIPSAALDPGAPLLEATLVTNAMDEAEPTKVQEVFVAQPAIEEPKSCLPTDTNGRIFLVVIVLIIAGVAVTGIMCGSGLCSAKSEPQPAGMNPPTPAPTKPTNSTSLPTVSPSQAQASNIFAPGPLPSTQNPTPVPSENVIQTYAPSEQSEATVDLASTTTPSGSSIEVDTISVPQSTTTSPTIATTEEPSQGPTTTTNPSTSPTVLTSSPTGQPTSNRDPVWLELLGNSTITEVELSFEDLFGTIPTQVGLQSNWLRLALGHNQLSGTIPTELGLLTQVTYLGLSYNDLSGTIPSQLALLTNLPHLSLNSNRLTGSIPSQLGLLTNIDGLYLWDNQLSGTVPNSVCLLTLEHGLNPSDSDPGLYTGLSIDCPPVVCPEEDCTCSCTDEYAASPSPTAVTNG